MDFVIVESPFATSSLVFKDGRGCVIEETDNVAYARACLHDCLVNHGEAPYASHLLYTQPGVLDDTVPEERKLGIEAGLELGRHALRRIFYIDRGISKGMKWGWKFGNENEQPFEIRVLGGQWDLGWASQWSEDELLSILRD